MSLGAKSEFYSRYNGKTRRYSASVVDIIAALAVQPQTSFLFEILYFVYY